MSKDEMSDDAEFEAFLKGEGELSRQLQALEQPSPSAQLDAAILGRVRTSMEQRQRDAANDPGEPAAAPKLAPSMGMRWRVPVGIAASVMVGLFATQAYQSGPSSELDEDFARERHAVLHEPPAAPAVAARAPSVSQAETAAPAPPLTNREPAVVVAAASERPAAAVADAVKSRSARRPAEGAIAAAPAAPPPVVVEAPVAPPATFDAAPAAPAASAMELAREREMRSASAAQAQREPDAESVYSAAGLAPAPANAPVMAAPPPPPPPAPQAAPAKPSVQAGGSALEKISVTGSRIRMAQDDKNAPVTQQAAWLEKIEKMLDEGDSASALLEWERFREKYPRYEVPASFEERMKALAR